MITYVYSVVVLAAFAVCAPNVTHPRITNNQISYCWSGQDRYQIGDLFKVDSCTSCRCENVTNPDDEILRAESVCWAAACDLDTSCNKPVLHAEECCPRCPANTTTETLTTRPHIMVTPAGSLKPHCKDHDEKVYAPNEKFKRNPCTHCKCIITTKGDQWTHRISCLIRDCIWDHRCSNPVRQKGECCPKCPDSAKNNVTQSPATDNQISYCWNGQDRYQIGDSFKIDRCTSCQCENATTFHDVIPRAKSLCLAMACDRDTSCNTSVVHPGECCARCPDNAKPNVTHSPATDNQISYCWNGQDRYKIGDSFKIDSCTSCQCENDTTFHDAIPRAKSLCMAMGCDRDTSCNTPVVHPGECCPRCPDTTEPRRIPTKAIAETTTTAPLSSCQFHGKHYSVGQRFNDGPCVDCECLPGGMASCTFLDCKRDLYPDSCKGTWVPVTGQCCHVCRDDSTSPTLRPTTPMVTRAPCEHQWKVYSVGDNYKVDCTYCDCLPDGPSCYPIDCPFHCKNPILAPNACCPICDDSPSVLDTKKVTTPTLGVTRKNKTTAKGSTPIVYTTHANPNPT